MFLRVLKLLGGAALLIAAQYAQAQDLIVNAFKTGAPVSGAQVSIDGEQAGATDGDGAFRSGELAPGDHSGSVSVDGRVINFQFSADAGETAVFSVTIPAQGEPATAIRVLDSGNTGALTMATISGVATSMETGGSIAGARISVPGTDYATTTGEDGSFELELPRGTYSVRIAHPEYGNREVSGVVAAPGLAANLDLQLSVAGGAGSIEEVVAVASYVPDTGSEQERGAAAVLDVIDSEQIARFGDSTAAAALKRVAGLTIQDGKFAVVRGLEGRYSTTTFNGAVMPSTDPTRRLVPLDLFPAGVIDQINVQKSFSPDVPGDATGGAIRMTSREYPDENTQKISMSLGYNSVVTGESVVHHDGGSTDWLGFDDGSRELPTIIDVATNGGATGFDDYDAGTREALGEVFEPNYAVTSENATPNTSLSITSGNSLVQGDTTTGYLLGFKYKNEWDLQDGVENTYLANLSPETSFDYEKAKNTIELGGMLALGLDLGYNHKFTSNTLVLRKSHSSTKVSRGSDFEDGDDTPTYKVAHEWVEQQILGQQFLGEHIIPSWNEAVLGWRATVSQGKRVSPDRISYQYQGRENDKKLRLIDTSTERRFDEMTDDTIQFGADLELPLGELGGFYSKLKSGFDVSDRERDSEVIRYGYTWQGSRAEELDITTDLNPDNILNPTYIRPDGFVIVNSTVGNDLGSTFVDSYEAQWDKRAWYLMGDVDYQSRFQVTGGFRVEDSDQRVSTSAQNVQLENDDVLPSISLTWFARDDLQFRSAFGQTVSRPDFTELAPSAVIDPDFGFPVVGNPDLKQTEVDNYDLRAEWYFSPTESVTLAWFKKDFTNPIERTLENASGTASDARTFTNAESATNEGVELDLRKELTFDKGGVHTGFVQANYAIIDSEVDLGRSTTEQSQTRPLQGQSDYIVNLQLGYDHFESGQKVTLLFNEFGERIALVDLGAKPPVMEEPFREVKLAYVKEFNLNFSVEASIENLLDEEVEFTQNDQVFRKYKPGRTFEVGFSYQF